ncbi:putative flavin-dependent thymidylate synthase [Bajunvirus bajun]|uniref:Flavin-dependent thymidylate synthase n=1 Tax=Brevundimonas phage vB_BgoS-Bajun TaxID=2948594 RepID=A0A9E7N4U4_9CAUD|nr:putative flavin-dependent thymidylate synthase [Brevundimonas phage vB_BgoS-Bajun]
MPHFTPSHIAVTAESIASSITSAGARIDTVKARYPRMVHADFMTHRVFSRNGSSSRAMPSVTLLADDPYTPTFRKNKAGMQPGEYLTPEEQQIAAKLWLDAADYCQRTARTLADKNGLNIHKQWTNRMLEWFGYITVVVTSTDWTNYMGLRDHDDAQDEIIWQAQAIRAQLSGAVPQHLPYGEWHLPFIKDEDRVESARFVREQPEENRAVMAATGFAFENLQFLDAVTRLLLVRSAARCARTSYNNFDGKKATIEKDIGTFLKLGSKPIHASPFEHQGRPQVYAGSPYCGNLVGFEQFRKFIPHERISAD